MTDNKPIDEPATLARAAPLAKGRRLAFPVDLSKLGDHQKAVPSIAKNSKILARIEKYVQQLPTSHRIHKGDARDLSFIPSSSVHLVVTSPPYWNLKAYNEADGQMGHIDGYQDFITELNKVWSECYRVLVPGGRLVCVVGDVCLSRRKNRGEHTVVPLHAAIQIECREVGFSNLAPIIWYKIANAKFEAQGNGAGFLGKPYEPNAVVKNDIEYILMERKPGGYRSPSLEARVLSVIDGKNHKLWFQQIWSGLTGASTRNHPAPYPLELAERLVRMFSFVGDTVLDPFMGTGTTTVASANWGRNSIGVDIDSHYIKIATTRMGSSLSSCAEIIVREELARIATPSDAKDGVMT